MRKISTAPVRNRSTDIGTAATRRLLHALLAVVLCVAAGAAAGALEPVRSWSEPDVVAQYWVDATGKASLQEARSQLDAGHGLPVDPRKIMPLGGGRAVWYRLKVAPPAVPTRAVLSVPYPGMDNVDFFRPTADGRWAMQRAGDSIPVSQWPVRYLHPSFTFTMQPDETQATYLRVQHSHPISVQWELDDASSFGEASKGWHLLLGAYLGFMALVVLVSGANAVLWRDRIHLFYAVHVVFIGLTLASLNGLAGEYFWPDNAWWNDIASVAIPAASLGWMGMFVRELVAERGKPLVSRVLLVHAGICAVVALAFLFYGRRHVFFFFNLYGAAGLVLLLAVLAWYSLRRPRVGLTILAGVALLGAGFMLPVLRNLGLAPVSGATQFGPQIGGALEIPLVLVGLYLRSRERRDNRVRLQSLAHNDPLTGVANHRVLMDRLEQLLEQRRRDPLLGTVIRVRVANLEAIRNEHGREAAGAALVRAVECVARQAQASDTVAREKGGDLVLVLEGRLSRQDASAAGLDIIARGLKYTTRLPPQVVLSLRVAVACAPFPGGDAHKLLAMLGDALTESASHPNGRALTLIGTLDPSAVARGRDDIVLSPMELP